MTDPLSCKAFAAHTASALHAMGIEWLTPYRVTVIREDDKTIVLAVESAERIAELIADLRPESVDMLSGFADRAEEVDPLLAFVCPTIHTLH